jgi:hypothetical protein
LQKRISPTLYNEQTRVRQSEGNFTTFAIRRHGGSLTIPERTFHLCDPNGHSRSYETTEENLLRVLAAYGFNLSSSNGLGRLYDDEYHAELDVMAHVIAYFDISSKRLIDEIPQVFETVFARDFGEKLGNTLTVNLKLVGERGFDNCARYVRDEPDVKAKRDHLTRQRKILDTAGETIDRFFK